MCGICGIWDRPDPQAVEAMVTAMRHRGPDDHGAYADQRVALGMSRLSILDVTPAGHQPMSNPEGTLWIVYNGEIYNFQSERKLLEAEGYAFRSRSDTEVVLRMYEHYGDDFVARMRGIFALAVYDKRGGPGSERLLLARDHLGIKPLLYTRAAGRLVFASELKALLASGLVAPEIDPVALRLLLTYGSVYQPRTMLAGVKMLLPAHRLIVDRGGERLERYWRPAFGRRPELAGEPYDALVRALADELEESVRLQMVSDVPLGAFLSGGVDSSVLVALMTQQAGDRVKTFSVGFETEGAEIDETDDAQKTAEFLGTDHSRVLVRASDVRERIEHIARGLDQPCVDGVNSYLVSMAARQRVTVAISGTGGDELFAGYPWFAAMALDAHRDRARPLRSAARALLAKAACATPLDPLLRTRLGSRLATARRLAGFASMYASQYNIFGARLAAGLLAPELRRRAQAGRAEQYDMAPMDDLPQGTPVQRVSALCLRAYTGNQLLRDIDAVSMAHSLEVRVPYLDPKVLDFALSLPDSAKLNDPAELEGRVHGTYRETGAKRILCDAGRPLLPEDYDLQPKRGFGMPFAAWMKGALRDVLMDTTSPRTVRHGGLLDPQAASAVTDKFMAGRIGWTKPWLMMMLELWRREVLDRAAPLRGD